MSETKEEYKSASDFLKYRKADWMIEKNKEMETAQLLEKCQRVFELIIKAERRHSIMIGFAQDWGSFPSLVKTYTHKADISKRASLRLRNYLNNITSEIQL